MTIEKARKILKGLAKDKTDAEIQAIMDSMEGIIEVGFRQFERKYKISHEYPLDTVR